MESKLSSAYVFKCHKALKLMGAPLTDWHCFEVIDYGMDSFTCELCGCIMVRYAHVMYHDK